MMLVQMLPKVKGSAAVCNNFFKKLDKHLVSRIVFDKCYHQQGYIYTKYKSKKNCFSLLQSGKSLKQLELSNILSTPVRRSLYTSKWLNPQTISNILVCNDSQCVDVTVGEEVLKIPFVWLRDHCRSETYYNSATNQKNADPELLQRDLTPSKVSLTKSGDGLVISWKDGHESSFTAQWLKENFYPGRFGHTIQKSFWNSESIQSQLPRVNNAEHMGSKEGLKKTLTNLIKYGFCVVDGAPASVEGTQAVVERVTFVLQTLFGGMWSFTADGSRSDTAFSTLGLGAHTDTTYMDSPAGIQVFQCLKHNGNGGETLLVDGFRAINELRQIHPEDFKLLSRLVIPHEYKEPESEHSSAFHLYSLATVICLHPSSGEILQLRFNPYDRAPLNTVPPQQQKLFYQAYEKLSRIISKKEGELWIKLRPGSVMLIDNWRVMHGRSAFDGERVMCGCYLPRDEWVSKGRTLGLL